MERMRTSIQCGFIYLIVYFNRGREDSIDNDNDKLWCSFLQTVDRPLNYGSYN